MERLTEIQRKILKYLKRFHEGIPYSEVTEKFIYAGIINEIDILVENELIELYLNDVPYRPKGIKGIEYPESVIVKITPKGREKFRETFITQIQDTAWKNPWAVITIVISLFLGIVTVYYYSENIGLQNENIKLQNKVILDNQLKQTMPPTVWLTQEYRNGSTGELEIIPTLYFKKNSERLFTIAHYEINLTLNGERESITGAGYKTIFKKEGINEGKIVFPSFYPASISEYNFFHTKDRNDLITDYSLEIKDMDSQIVYRGNVTTEINSSIFCSTCPNSGYEPIIFNWTKV